MVPRTPKLAHSALSDEELVVIDIEADVPAKAISTSTSTSAAKMTPSKATSTVAADSANTTEPAKKVAPQFHGFTTDSYSSHIIAILLQTGLPDVLTMLISPVVEVLLPDSKYGIDSMCVMVSYFGTIYFKKEIGLPSSPVLETLLALFNVWRVSMTWTMNYARYTNIILHFAGFTLLARCMYDRPAAGKNEAQGVTKPPKQIREFWQFEGIIQLLRLVLGLMMFSLSLIVFALRVAGNWSFYAIFKWIILHQTGMAVCGAIITAYVLLSSTHEQGASASFRLPLSRCLKVTACAWMVHSVTRLVHFVCTGDDHTDFRPTFYPEAKPIIKAYWVYSDLTLLTMLTLGVLSLIAVKESPDKEATEAIEVKPREKAIEVEHREKATEVKSE